MRATFSLKDIRTIGELTLEQQARRVWEMSEPEPTTEGGLESLAYPFDLGPARPWQHSAHQIGYIAPLSSGSSGPWPIVSPATIPADLSLRNKQIDVHLSRLRIFDYPGWGTHQILFTFKAQNQVPNAPEPVSFSQAYAVRQGETAAVIGQPMFLGLSVGAVGTVIEATTVNVKNNADQDILGFLDSPTFKAGLGLLTTPQPAIKPLADLAIGLTKMVADHNKNVPVQYIALGLDFGTTAMGMRLAEGNYLAVQVPNETTIKWDEWVFDPRTGAIALKTDPSSALPYNYLAFEITRSSG